MDRADDGQEGGAAITPMAPNDDLMHQKHARNPPSPPHNFRSHASTSRSNLLSRAVAGSSLGRIPTMLLLCFTPWALAAPDAQAEPPPNDHVISLLEEGRGIVWSAD